MPGRRGGLGLLIPRSAKRVSRDKECLISWFETAQERLLTMRPSLTRDRRDRNRDRYETLGLSGLSGATTELSQRKSERQPRAHFVDWMAVGEGMTQPDVETEVIADFPNQTDQT
jgi:hypothetical protein